MNDNSDQNIPDGRHEDIGVEDNTVEDMDESNDEVECRSHVGDDEGQRTGQSGHPRHMDDEDSSHQRSAPHEDRRQMIRDDRDGSPQTTFSKDSQHTRLAPEKASWSPLLPPAQPQRQQPLTSGGNGEKDDYADEISSCVSPDKTNIIYATNISPVVTQEQMRTLFGFLGDILDIALYHFEKPPPETSFKVCFVEFSQHSSALMAQHLTNTIFIDRAIFVLPYNKTKIPPDAEAAAALGFDSSDYVTNFNPGVVTQVTTGPNGAQVLTTSDQRLTAASLQQYPQLPMSTDPTRIEEIRRTLYIGNLDSSMNPEAVLKFFNDIGEVKYIRVAGDETQPTRFAFVEFTHQASVANAILYNGFVFGTRALKINHSNNPIVKPQPKLEIEDPSKRRLDGRSSHRDMSSRSAGDGRHQSSRNDRKRDRSRGYYDRRMSPRDQRSRRSRSRDSDAYSRSRRSRSRDHSSRRDRSRDDSLRRRSRSPRDSSRRRRSRSRSSDRRSKHKSSSRRR